MTKRPPSSRFNGEIRAQVEVDRAELLIFGDIGDPWDPESPQALDAVREISSAQADVIDLRVNSYGGSVADGLAIYNALLRHPARVVGHVEGVAASIASVILMAADEVRAADSSVMMVHAPWGFSMGNASDMRDTADMLDRHAETLARAYARRVDEDTAREWVNARTDFWFTAEEAVDAGLADRLTSDVADGQLAAAMWQRYSDRSPPVMVAAWVRDHNGGRPMPKKAGKPAASAVEDVTETEDVTPETETETETETEDVTPETVTADEVAAAALIRAQAALAERAEEIAAMFEPFQGLEGVAALQRKFTGTEKGMKKSVDDVRAALLAHLGQGAQALGGPQFEEDPNPAPSSGSDWKALVDAKVQAGLSRKEAIKAVDAENPGARAAFLKSYNKGNEHLVTPLARVS